MPELKVIRNLLAPQKFETIPITVGTPIAELLPLDLPHDQLQVIWNGKAYNRYEEILGLICRREGDQFIARVIPGEPGTLFLIGLAITIVSTGVSFALQALTPRPKLNNKLYDNTEESPTYSWDGVQNTTQNGTPIPLVFGRHRVAGQYLSTFVTIPEGNKSYLSFLIGLCAGPISAISGQTRDTYYDPATGMSILNGASVPADFLVNENPANEYKELEVYYRRGGWDQSLIRGFQDTVEYHEASDYSIDPELRYEDDKTIVTRGEVQAIDLLFRFPQGLYSHDVSGAFRQYEVAIKVEYRVNGSGGAFAGWDTVKFSAQTRSQYEKMVSIIGLPIGIYDIKLTRLTLDDEDYEVSTSYLGSTNERLNNDVMYKGIALCGGSWLATEQLNGRLPTMTNLVHGTVLKVFQPGDDFSADRTQDMLAGTLYDPGAYDTTPRELLWGWNVRGLGYLDYSQVCGPTANAFDVKHGATASRWGYYDMGSYEYTSSFFYKKIRGLNWDVRIVIEYPNGLSSGDAAYLTACRTTNGIPTYTQYAQIGLMNDGATKWEYRIPGEYGADSINGATTTAEKYYRIVCTNGIQNFYSSTDGVAWTKRNTNAYLATLYDEDDCYLVGVMVSSHAATPENCMVRFTDFTFADAECHSLECSNNPAWVVYYLLTQAHYGMGDYISEDDIDLDTFLGFAAFCDELVADGYGGTEKRFCYDGIIDAANASWEKIIDILAMYRAVPLRQGNRIRVAWECPKVHTQVFSMANIKKGTFEAVYQTPQLGANYWEIQFLNEEANYAQDFVGYVDKELEENEPYRKQTTTRYGTTRPSEANRVGRFLCKKNRHQTVAVGFVAGVDAIACEPLDRIEVQHDVPGWGDSGYVLSADTASITLDQPTTLVGGNSYEIMIRHANDAIEIQTVLTSGTFTTSVLEVDMWDTLPQAGDIWVVGVQNILTKPFIVTEIKRTSDLECKISAINYVEGVYDDDIENIPYVVYSNLPDPRKFPGNVSELVLTERAQLMKDGTIQSVIDVTFKGGDNAAGYEIFLRETGYEAWRYQGYSRGTHFVVSGNLKEGTRYDICVVSISPFGMKRLCDGSPWLTIKYNGKVERPPDVGQDSFRLTRVGQTVIMRWDPVVIGDLGGYEIRYGKVNDWASTTWLAWLDKTPEKITTDFPAATEYYFMVKAVNRSGIYSETAASVQDTLPDDFIDDVIVSHSGRPDWTGTKVDASVVGHDLVMDGGQTICSYETPVLDIGVVATVELRAQFSSALGTEDYTWNSATFTWDSATAANTTWDGNPDGGQIESVMWFRYGDTTPTGAYIRFQRGYYIGQYFQFKLVTQVDSTGYGATIHEMICEVEPPDVVESANNVLIDDTDWTTITFQSFNVTPTFHATPHNGAVGDTIQTQNVDKDSIEVKYFDSTGAKVAGNIDWTARGY